MIAHSIKSYHTEVALEARSRILHTAVCVCVCVCVCGAGTESEAMTVEFVLVDEQQGTYVMVNLGKPGDDKTKAKKRSPPYPALGDYISYHSSANSDWVSSSPSWALTEAMTVEMWQPGKAAPPPPPGPPAPTPCSKRFDFRCERQLLPFLSAGCTARAHRRRRRRRHRHTHTHTHTHTYSLATHFFAQS